MIKIKKLGIFFPIRLESERLPNKLILPLGNSNLIEICCKKLNEISDKYDKYVLCPNNKKILNIVNKYKNIKIIIRDKETCLVDGPLKFIYKDLEKVNNTHLMFLNGCLYNLSKETIERACNEFVNSDCDYATSVKELKNWIFDKNFNSVNEIDFEKLNTKLIKPMYQTAHCFHIFNKNKFFKDGKMLNKDFLKILIDNNEALDIDNYIDYLLAKIITNGDCNVLL